MNSSQSCVWNVPLQNNSLVRTLMNLARGSVDIKINAPKHTLALVDPWNALLQRKSGTDKKTTT